MKLLEWKEMENHSAGETVKAQNAGCDKALATTRVSEKISPQNQKRKRLHYNMNKPNQKKITNKKLYFKSVLIGPFLQFILLISTMNLIVWVVTKCNK